MTSYLVIASSRFFLLCNMYAPLFQAMGYLVHQVILVKPVRLF